VRDTEVIAAGHGPWSGRTVAEAQAIAFGDNPLQTLAVPVGPGEAIRAAEASAKRMGWRVTLSDPDGGRLEAVATSRWYGLATDIAVRAEADGAGSQLDVRAAGRQAGGDVGALARRIQALQNDVAFALRGE
jgi:hypothetical protein